MNVRSATAAATILCGIAAMMMSTSSAASAQPVGGSCDWVVTNSPEYTPPQSPPCGLGGNCSMTWLICPGPVTCTKVPGSGQFGSCSTASSTVICSAYTGGFCVAGSCVKGPNTMPVGDVSAGGNAAVTTECHPN